MGFKVLELALFLQIGTVIIFIKLDLNLSSDYYDF